MLSLRPATADDIPALEDLIFEHGTNEWNHLPETEVKEHLAAIATGAVRAVVAIREESIVGVITFETGLFYPEYEAHPDTIHGYVAEGVVHRDRGGRGIGVQMMEEVLRRIRREGIRHIYAKRHEENPYSSRLLKQCGFVEIATFDDPLVRPTGSRRTTVCRYVVS